MSKDSLTYEIKKQVGLVGCTSEDSYRMELNLVSWNGSAAKYDLRTWYCRDGVRKPLKGITLDQAQVDALKELLNDSALAESDGQLSLFGGSQ